MSFTVLAERMKRESSGHTRRMWLCSCSCGDTRWRYASHVKSGKSGKCKKCANKTHGQSHTCEYKAWYAVLHRCTNPNSQWYRRYGGRGITVTPAWYVYENFLADMGCCPDGKSLERVDNSKGYSKDNCVWATQREQMANYSCNVQLTAFGRTQHVAAWAREFRLRHDTLSYRLKKGWAAEKALSTPVRKTHHA